jgi:hypothetical protein
MRPLRISMTAALLAALVAATPSSAAVIWDESLQADLSNTQGTPTALVLEEGTNTLAGKVNGASDSQDFVSLFVPAGQFLSSITLTVYASADGKAFTGVQAGSSFVGSPFSASSYAGYAHFGSGATNGAVVGADVLAIMADPALALGATGLSVPLGTGVYTFLIQQTGSSLTSYQFDYEVVPEPSTSLLTAAGIAVIAWRRRRVRG